MKKRIAITVILILGVAILSPMISRCGRWKTIHQWEAPQGTFGLDRSIHLSVQEFHAFVDPLMLYEENRIVVSDGGYAYIVETDLSFFQEVSESKVKWHADAVSITFPSGVSIQIPRDRVVEQTGT